MFQLRPGITNLLKDGSRAFSGLDEAVLRNIEACVNLNEMTQTSYGPNSMNKLIVNHLGKQFITSDLSTIIEELDIQHPAANMLVMACKRQAEEYGDASNTVLIFAGELLRNAAKLLNDNGLHPSDIVAGYEIALERSLSLLNGMVAHRVANFKNVGDLSGIVRPLVLTKNIGYSDLITRLTCEAIASIMPDEDKLKEFNIDNVRIVKLLGGSPMQSFTINGMMINREPGGTIRNLEKVSNVMVLGCGLEMTGTEAKGTVVLNNAQELLDFTRGEESLVENLIKEIKQTAKIDAIFAGGPISDIAQHFCNKYDILTLRITSKWELRRICRSIGAVAMVRLGVPLPEEIGKASSIRVEEIGSKKVTVINALNTKVSSVILRGATQGILDEMERAIANSVSVVKSSTKDNRFVAGAGATFVELSKCLRAYDKSENKCQQNSVDVPVPGMEEYAVNMFAEALDIFPRLLAENSGLNSTDLLASLHAVHQQGSQPNKGINVFCGSGTSPIIDCISNNEQGVGLIVDHLGTLCSALKLATDSAVTILKIDEIIMAKPAGGPKPRSQNDDMD
ncbi:T-complex protein 1, theta subunit [Cryptosporidium meleagridis]|uniref:T-complex protein 1, theta subunit n=1 Tax=Cryptosporidium meleagridis TaxID=93969 RepID=A0A2P4Z6K3_9CRYT|nr:T-complex protein 1, theta subunit [Cryptosporidium meleagridis]